MRLTGVAVGAIVVAACGGEPSKPPVDATRFSEPLDGTRNQRFFYLNYVDEEPGTGFHDYNCGPKTYEGHRGTDITLANFAVMDSGVAVRAAAAGIVGEVHDGEFDRRKAWVTGAIANYVMVRHPDGVEAWYLHFKKNSIAVHVGQEVQIGELLGYVGSSGFSDIPHLHFEVIGANGEVIDPWAGGCGATESMWQQQLSYQDAFTVYGSGLTNQAMSLDLAKDPPPQVGTFRTTDAQVSLWVELLNAPAGTVLEFRLYQPDGALYFADATTLDRHYSISWWWAWHAIPGYLAEGTWRMLCVNNGAILADRTFIVSDAPLPVAGPVTFPASRAGTGGGGAGKPEF